MVCLVLLVVGSAATWEYGRNHQWWGETDRVQELKADPLASAEILGYRQIRSEGSGTEVFKWKSSGDEVWAWYSTGTENPVLARDRVVDFALDHGYMMVNPAVPPGESVVVQRHNDEGARISAKITAVVSPGADNEVMVHLWFV